MSTPFQNRLVGSIIVAAIVVIFLPDILDGEKKTYQAEFEAIPEAPAFKSKGNKAQEFPEQKLALIPKEKLHDDVATDVEQTNVSESAQQDDSNTQVSALPKEKAIVETQQTASATNSGNQDASGKKLPEKSVMGEAWVIHLGSFKHKKNVDELMRKLKDGGYTAYTQPIKTKSGVLTKVIVGPELIKSELTKKIPALKELTKVQGKLAKYRPTK